MNEWGMKNPNESGVALNNLTHSCAKYNDKEACLAMAYYLKYLFPTCSEGELRKSNSSEQFKVCEALKDALNRKEFVQNLKKHIDK